ncbi:hypothetical protein [Streptomyces sp. NBC_01483]|uniref:hypothetical protein n=1 Tax=Streptomyces sp. NBC_01483 TaxID=2903883 RepID=UPI002E31CFC9|nr:hypothetical protein [Streptomyces sp. NBC_01483]
MFTHRTNPGGHRTSSLRHAMRVPLGVAAAVVLTTLGAAGPATALPAQRSEPAKPDYGFSLEQPYLTSDVGGTLTVRPKVFTSRPDGSRFYVPEGAPLGAGIAIEYTLPEDTSPVGLDEHKSCRKVKSAMDPGRLHIRCDTVSPLTFHVDKAFIGHVGIVKFVPVASGVDEGRNRQDDSASFFVTAPAPQEEGETEESRARRETVGAALLGVAGGFAVLAVLVLFLTRARARRTMWASCTAAALCAGLGTWSMVHGPVLGTKTFTRGYPAGPATLETPGTIWDTSRILEEERPDYVPAIATAPDPGHESVTEVSAFYSAEAAGASRELWLALDGAYGRIKDPRRARNHMLETAAGAPGVKVVKKPQLIVLREKQPVLFKCQALSIRDRTFAMCAWADSGVRALVTIAGDSLLGAAGNANALRDYVQLGDGF